jgi:hypothetical protein
MVLLVNPETGGIIRKAHISQLQPFVQWLKVLLCTAKWTHIFCLFTFTSPLTSLRQWCQECGMDRNKDTLQLNHHRMMNFK